MSIKKGRILCHLRKVQRNVEDCLFCWLLSQSTAMVMGDGQFT